MPKQVQNTAAQKIRRKIRSNGYLTKSNAGFFHRVSTDTVPKVAESETIRSFPETEVVALNLQCHVYNVVTRNVHVETV